MDDDPTTALIQDRPESFEHLQAMVADLPSDRRG
jgi:hypothetical protein